MTEKVNEMSEEAYLKAIADMTGAPGLSAAERAARYFEEAKALRTEISRLREDREQLENKVARLSESMSGLSLLITSEIISYARVVCGDDTLYVFKVEETDND